MSVEIDALQLGEKGLAGPFPVSEGIKSVPELVADKRESSDVAHFRSLLRALQSARCTTLIVRLHTVADPLMLWALHCELDKRGVPPCVRWPANEAASPQLAFITWLGDLFWFCKRNPRHTTAFRGWRGLFKHAPGSPGWHATAHRQYVFIAARYSVAHWCSKGLGLAPAHRHDLMMFPTSAMNADRRQLHRRHFAEISERVLTHAMSHRDRSGRHSPETIAARRAAMWRVFVLSMRCQTATAKRWNLVTGDNLTRQAIAKQIATVSDVLDTRT